MPVKKALKLYLDTSIFNFAISKQGVEAEKAATLKLLDQIRNERFETFVSEVVLREIARAKADKQRDLLDVMKSLPLENLLMTPEVESLADKYIEEKIIPARYRDDALHMAVASVYHLDVVVSWNFEHLVKVKTRREVQGANTMMGYRTIDLATPMEVMHDE